MNRTKLHSMENIIFISMSAVICGAETWDEIETFGNRRTEWLSRYLDLSNGIPSHDTFNRFFSYLDPVAFEQCFRTWVADIISKVSPTLDKDGNPIRDIISVDGKTIRGSKTFENSAIHIVSAWSNQHKVTLGQLKTEDKSNEITAIPELLEALLIEDSIVTIDAMGCQVDIAETIIEKKADYILAVKGNQPLLVEGIMDSFRFLPPYDIHKRVEGDHGRIETRVCSVITDLSMIENAGNWPNLKSIVKIDSERVDKLTGEVQTSSRYYISSLNTDARTIGRAVRSHWGVENELHWMMDVGFNEDAGRKRNRNAIVNFSLVKKISMMMLKKDNTTKMGIKSKRFQAALDTEYLMQVLTGE